MQRAYLEYFVRSMRLGIDPPDQLTTHKNRQREVTKFAFRLRRVALNAIVEIEHLERAFAIPYQRIERREQRAVGRVKLIASRCFQ